jgi:cyclic nucleotide gated channel
MDDILLDALYEQLKHVFYIEGVYIALNGDPMYEISFIVRGELESVITNGGSTSFFNIGILKLGDFYGNELFTWALDFEPNNNLPTSIHIVHALTKVDVFAFYAKHFEFVANEF